MELESTLVQAALFGIIIDLFAIRCRLNASVASAQPRLRLGTISKS
jgi:hypothetical protein